MSSDRLRYNQNNIREQTKTEEKEKKWDQRFFLYKIPPYDAFKDENYLSLGLMKSKIKYEQFLQKEKQKKLRGKTHHYTEHYVIDSQSGNKTSKEKKRKLLFSATFNKFPNENYKNNNFAQTYSYKYPGIKKNKTEETQLTMEEIDLLDEFEIIKTMWNKLGVTKNYQENFINFINNLDDLGNVRLYLNLEQKQMQKFKYDLTQLLKKIIHRNDQISYLKQLISIYKNILKEKKSHPELENENLDTLCNKNEKQVIEDINSCLLTIRINTINVVNQIKSFHMSNSYFLYMNKINLEKIKEDYYYNDEYLLTIKSDLDFIQHSILTNLYEFDNFDGGDPFFLSFSKIKEETKEKQEDKQNNQKRKLEINKKVLEEVQNCIFFMLQAEILYKTKNVNKSEGNKNKVLQFLKCGINDKEENCKKKSYGIGNLFKSNNLEQDIVKLKMTKGYDRIFNFIKTNNSNPYLSLNKENRLKKSSKRKQKIPVMTSQELKNKFNQYELLNELINEPNNENKKEDDFKKRDQEVNIANIQKNEEKKEDLEQDHYNKEFEDKKENETNTEEVHDKEEKKEIKEEENKEIKEEDKKEIKEEEKKEIKEDEKKDTKEEEKKDEEIDKKEEKHEEKEEDNKKQSDSKIEEEIDEVIQQAQNENKKEEIIPTYSPLFFTESLDKLSFLYNDYLNSNPNIYTTNSPNKSKDFISGIYPKIIIVKKDNVNEDKIYGICGINYYIYDNKEFILKINHISVCDNNKDLLNKMIDLIEKEIKYQIIEIELVKDRDENNELIEILKNKEYKECRNDDNKIIMRKENNNGEIKEIGSQINYDSLAVLSLVKKDDNEIKDKKYIYFNKVMNPIILSLLIDKLKINDKYKIEIISTLSSHTTLVEKLSSLENKVFDFIKTQNNDCSNISEITNNEIASKEGFCYSMINNCLNIQMNTLMTLYIDNYLYNGIDINVKNNIIKDPKYNNNLYCLPTNNQNIFIILYQYNEEFETFMSQDKGNIYNQFSSLFNIMIKNYLSEAHDDNDTNNKKTLWIPSFNINTNLFSSELDICKHINIKNSEDNEIKINEFNEFLKICYLPDDNKDKNIEMNVNNSNNDIVIKDKFLFGICHKEFMECCDMPVICLVNVTKENIIYKK